MKRILKRFLRSLGYDIQKVRHTRAKHQPTSVVATMSSMIKDLKDRGLNCSHILDVGANKCEWSRLAIKYFPEARFTLIEPQIEVEDFLVRFCEQFSGSQYHLVGAGKKNETLMLTIYDDLAGSSLLPHFDPGLAERGKQREVSIRTIESILTEHNLEPPQLVKLDIQGFELEALKGAELLFGKTEVFILEVSLFSFGTGDKMPEFAEVIAFMKARGYVAYDFPGFLRRPLDQALGQCDICFVQENGFLRSSHAWGN